MPRITIHLALCLFFVTALSGVWMRAIPFIQNSLIEYDNMLHGHSHIAILGWAFLGVFIIFLATLWPSLKQKTHGLILVFVIFIVSIIMFGTFLYEGYATYSIIMSTVHIFVEYWAVYFIYKQLTRQMQIPRTAKLFIKGSLIALIFSTIGPFLLGYLGATGLPESSFFDMAIYFYLHFQYNGWLFLFLFGLFILILHKNKIRLSTKLSTYGFWIYFTSLFPWYFSAILWTDIGNFGKVIATVGSLGQWIGIVFILFAVKRIWIPITHKLSKTVSFCLLFSLGLLFFKSTMELGLISPALSDLVFNTRSVIIGYLHFTLLGFISLFIITQYQMIHLIEPKTKSVILGLRLFLVGFVINEFLLFTSGLVSWFSLASIPYYSEGLLISSILLLLGVSCLWFSLAKRHPRSL